MDRSDHGGSNGTSIRLGSIVVQTQPGKPTKNVETVNRFQRVLVLTPFICHRLCASHRAWPFYLSLQGMV